MGHDHDHRAGGHAGHSHGVSADADRGKLTIALALIVGFMLFEVVVGAVVHSLALLSDAAHMLTYAGAIALLLVAIRLAAKPAKGAMPTASSEPRSCLHSATARHCSCSRC